MPAIIVDMLSGQLIAPAGELVGSERGLVAHVLDPEPEPELAMPGMPAMAELEPALVDLTTPELFDGDAVAVVWAGVTVIAEVAFVVAPAIRFVPSSETSATGTAPSARAYWRVAVSEPGRRQDDESRRSLDGRRDKTDQVHRLPPLEDVEGVEEGRPAQHGDRHESPVGTTGEGPPEGDAKPDGVDDEEHGRHALVRPVLRHDDRVHQSANERPEEHHLRSKREPAEPDLRPVSPPNPTSRQGPQARQRHPERRADQRQCDEPGEVLIGHREDAARARHLHRQGSHNDASLVRIASGYKASVMKL
jgi:hypothetical protein